MLANIAVHATSDDSMDAITGLSARTQFGRPDFTIFFDKLTTAIEKGFYLPGRESSLKTTVNGRGRASIPLRSPQNGSSH